jgi:flagellar biogenesis protein FliO
MAVQTAPTSTSIRPLPQGLWGYFWLWVTLLVIGAAVAAPAAHAEDQPRVFGEQSNMADQQPQSQPLPGEPAAQAGDTAKPAMSADDKKPAYLSEDQPLQLKDYEDPKPAEPAPWWQQVLGFGFKLLMVIGLIFGSLAAVKKLSGGKMALNLPNTKGRNIVVLESTHLNPQQAIHMISLGGERLLVVGAGPQGLSTLTEITDPAQVRLFLQAQKTTPSASTFNQVFDLQQVVQDTHSDLLGETLAEVDDDPRFDNRRRWPGS